MKLLKISALMLALIGFGVGCSMEPPTFGDVRDNIDTEAPMSSAERDAWSRNGFDPAMFSDLSAWNEDDIASFEKANAAIVAEFLTSEEPRDWVLFDEYEGEDGAVIQVYRSGPFTKSIETVVLGPSEEGDDPGVLVDSDEFRALQIEVPDSLKRHVREREEE